MKLLILRNSFTILMFLSAFFACSWLAAKCCLAWLLAIKAYAELEQDKQNKH